MSKQEPIALAVKGQRHSGDDSRKLVYCNSFWGKIRNPKGEVIDFRAQSNIEKSKETKQGHCGRHRLLNLVQKHQAGICTRTNICML